VLSCSDSGIYKYTNQDEVCVFFISFIGILQKIITLPFTGKIVFLENWGFHFEEKTRLAPSAHFLFRYLYKGTIFIHFSSQPSRLSFLFTSTQSSIHTRPTRTIPFFSFLLFKYDLSFTDHFFIH